MAQWFHRNPFKASGRPNFDLGPVAADIPTRMYLNYLTERRKTLMRCLEDLTCSRSSIVEAANQYITLLLGLATSPDTGDVILDETDDSDDESEKKDEEMPEPGASDATEQSKKGQRGNLKREKEAKKKDQKAKPIPAQQVKIQSLRRLISFTWTNSLDVKHRFPLLVSWFMFINDL